MLMDGDYLILQNAIVATLTADTGSGGVRDTSDPTVALIEGELRREPRLYRTHEIPALAVCILGKDERTEGAAVLQQFRVACFIYCRGMSVTDEIARCQRIAARVETVLRAQTVTDAQFQNAPQSLADSDGALTVELTHTEFVIGRDVPKGQPDYAVMAVVECLVTVPCSRT